MQARYEYENQNTAGIKLSAITANGQRWEYSYEPITGYLYDHYQHLVAVQRPDGRRWQYEYNPAPRCPPQGWKYRDWIPNQHTKKPVISDEPIRPRSD